MESAFGIDHGEAYEFEKALPGMGALRTFGGALARKTTQAGGAMGAKSAVMGAKVRSAPGVATLGRSAKVSAAGGLGKLGGGLKKLGGGMAARPGLTGGIAAGGAAAGLGGGAAALHTPDRQKLTQYR